MGIFDSHVMFSRVRGVVLMDGEPIAGAKITRSWRWAWSGAQGSDEVVTDEVGAFEFGVQHERSVTAHLFPHEPVITQKIDVTHAGNVYEAWRFSKRNYRVDGELYTPGPYGQEGAPAAPLVLRCELTQAPGHREPHGVYGICEIVTE